MLNHHKMDMSIAWIIHQELTEPVTEWAQLIGIREPKECRLVERRNKLGWENRGTGAHSCWLGCRAVCGRWSLTWCSPSQRWAEAPWFRQTLQTRLTRGEPQQKTTAHADQSWANFQSTFSSQGMGNPVASSCGKDLAKTQGRTSQRNVRQRPIRWPQRFTMAWWAGGREQISGHTCARDL